MENDNVLDWTFSPLGGLYVGLSSFSFWQSLTHLFSNACLKNINIHIIMLRALGALSKNKELDYARYMFS